MISCESNDGELKKIVMRGSEADLLADFAAIADGLLKGGLPREKIIFAFSAGIFRDEIEKSDKEPEEIFKMMEQMAKEAFEDTNPHGGAL